MPKLMQVESTAGVAYVCLHVLFFDNDFFVCVCARVCVCACVLALALSPSTVSLLQAIHGRAEKQQRMTN